MPIIHLGVYIEDTIAYQYYAVCIQMYTVKKYANGRVLYKHTSTRK